MTVSRHRDGKRVPWEGRQRCAPHVLVMPLNPLAAFESLLCLKVHDVFHSLGFDDARLLLLLYRLKRLGSG